jgi:lipopolysaccharide export LptBFGC system permease protein LptF
MAKELQSLGGRLMVIRMKTLDRYLLAEMLWPFVGGLLTFATLITGHMLFLAIEVLVDHHVPLWGVMRYVGYQLPGATIMALPVATLLASSLALNRLARDHEFIALRAGGASPVRLLLPAAAFGVLAMALSVWLSGAAAPNARQAAEGLLREVVLQQKTLVFKPYQFLDTGRGLHLYVEGTDQRENIVQGLHVFCLRAGGLPMLLWAPLAQFGATTLQVPTPRFYVLDATGNLTWGDSESIDIDLTRVGASAAFRSNQMADLTLTELQRRRQQGETAAPGSGKAYLVEIHSRLAMAFACVVFALVAGPVTWRFGRGQSLVGVLATILVVFVFYVAMLWTRMLATSGIIPPLLATWGQDALFLGVALVAIWRQR